MIDFRNDMQVAYVFGIACLIIAGLGCLSNPLIGPDALFLTNMQHNELNAIAGLVLLVGGFILCGKTALLLIGVGYVLLGIAGYQMMDDTQIGPFAINLADHYLHVLMGVTLIAAGALVRPYKAPAVAKARMGKKAKKK